ncbi:MAG: HlyD family efflux transporter periplasmic adaptor subunit [Opitutaceae bacterium]
MDIQRPDQSRAKRKKRILLIAIGAVVLIGVTILLARLKPAVPSLDRNLVWTGEVKRGQMLRQVRGLGTLVPEDITWLAARTPGRVDKILLRPGAIVTPDSIILILSNPDVERAATDADSKFKAAEAELENLKFTIQSSVLAQESLTAGAKAEYEQAKLKAEVNDQLFKDGLVSELELRLSKVTAEQAGTKNAIEQKRYAFTKDSTAPQLAVKQAEVDRLRDEAKQRHDELDALQVRAGMNGLLTLLGTATTPVDVGTQVQPGTNLARVADPTRLKAEVRVAETQAKDIQIGQLAEIDTRNGIVAGKVSRIDPSVQNGTVTVDVKLTGELPKGSRQDLSVDGTIELERLDNVVYVGRPAFGQENSTVGIFKLDEDKVYATRTQVKFGRSSVNTIEVVSGLKPGDWVILSDMSANDSNDRIKLN